MNRFKVTGEYIEPKVILAHTPMDVYAQLPNRLTDEDNKRLEENNIDDIELSTVTKVKQMDPGGLVKDIIHALIDDDEQPYRKEARLLSIYADSNQKEKKFIDQIFITITGWSLNTLIKDEEGYNMDHTKEVINMEKLNYLLFSMNLLDLINEQCDGLTKQEALGYLAENEKLFNEQDMLDAYKSYYDKLSEEV